MEVKYDRDELEQKLLEVFTDLFSLHDITDETPIEEARARVVEAGRMFGRAFCACLHKGPIEHDTLFYLRTAEQFGEEAFLNSLRKRRPLSGL